LIKARSRAVPGLGVGTAHVRLPDKPGTEFSLGEEGSINPFPVSNLSSDANIYGRFALMVLIALAPGGKRSSGTKEGENCCRDF
jgi:hypothetical protein